MRRVLACLTGSLIVLAGLSPAATATTPDPSHHLKSDGAHHGTAPGTGDRQGSAAVDPSQRTAEFVELDQPCAAGLVRGTTHTRADFEDGVPYAEITNGWSLAYGDAAQGTAYARSTLDPSEGSGVAHWLPLSYADKAPAGGRLTMSFRFRTDAAAQHAWVIVSGSDAYTVAQPNWTTVYLDVEAARADPTDGSFWLAFDHENFDVPEGVSEFFDVDDVQVYSCVAPPATGIRGDWNSDRRADLLGTTHDGSLYLYPGKGTGAVTSGTKIGSGWAGMTWMGSPGDVTLDKRTDLVARAADGTMYLYAGRGVGTFSAARKIGVGWGNMTSLATPGDINKDGQADLLARRSDGTLHHYRFVSDGSLRYVKQVGKGWNGMKWIIGMGDLNGDGRGDAVGVRTDDGCLYAYATTSTGALAGLGRLGCGWTPMNILASPGDLTGDGLGDLVARRSDDTLWVYTGKGGGRLNSGVKIGTGWGAMARLS